MERNFKTPFGEADLVVKSPDGFVCFVEVKARLTDAYGEPAEAVTYAKQQRYRMIARYWVSLEQREVPIRFDVASVEGDSIEYFENAYI